jgi:hypothetical protein
MVKEIRVRHRSFITSAGRRKRSLSGVRCGGLRLRHGEKETRSRLRIQKGTKLN